MGSIQGTEAHTTTEAASTEDAGGYRSSANNSNAVGPAPFSFSELTEDHKQKVAQSLKPYGDDGEDGLKTEIVQKIPAWMERWAYRDPREPGSHKQGEIVTYLARSFVRPGQAWLSDRLVLRIAMVVFADMLSRTSETKIIVSDSLHDFFLFDSLSKKLVLEVAGSSLELEDAQGHSDDDYASIYEKLANEKGFHLRELFARRNAYNNRASGFAPPPPETVLHHMYMNLDQDKESQRKDLVLCSEGYDLAYQSTRQELAHVYYRAYDHWVHQELDVNRLKNLGRIQEEKPGTSEYQQVIDALKKDCEEFLRADLWAYSCTCGTNSCGIGKSEVVLTDRPPISSMQAAALARSMRGYGTSRLTLRNTNVTKADLETIVGGDTDWGCQLEQLILSLGDWGDSDLAEFLSDALPGCAKLKELQVNGIDLSAEMGKLRELQGNVPAIVEVLKAGQAVSDA